MNGGPRRRGPGRLLAGAAVALCIVAWSTTAVSADDSTTTTVASPTEPDPIVRAVKGVPG